MRLNVTGVKAPTLPTPQQGQPPDQNAHFWDWSPDFSPATPGAVTQDEAVSQTTTTGPITSTGYQQVTNKNSVYRIPHLEAYAQFQRSQVSLIDERFAELSAKELSAIWGRS